MTKFGSSIDFDLWVTVTSSNTEPEVVWSRRGRHLKIVYDVITPLRVAQFGRKLGTLFGISHMVKIAKGRRISTAKLKIRIFCLPNYALWVSASGGFRIVSDTLVKHCHAYAMRLLSFFYANIVVSSFSRQMTAKTSLAEAVRTRTIHVLNMQVFLHVKGKTYLLILKHQFYCMLKLSIILSV